MNNKLKDFKKHINGRKAAVIGVGISNRPLIKWLSRNGMTVTAFDILSEDDPSIVKTKDEFASESINVEWSLGKDYLKLLQDNDYDYVFKTPKMRLEIPELVAASNRGGVLTSEMELFMALCPCKIFAVTGSDGKTTTTTLISEILKTAGYKVWLGGNIGTPLLDKIDEISEDDMVVLELSSFQLMNMAHSADVAVVTNVTPNHLDFHKDYDEYISSKCNVFRNQDATGLLVLNGKCDITFDMRKIARGNVSFFAQDRENTVRSNDNKLNNKAYLCDGNLTIEIDGEVKTIINENDIFIPGKHNVENFLAATLATINYVSISDISKVAREFKGVPHRIEFIREIDGVRYYNSSIDTSPNRAMNTLNALHQRGEKGVLIAGGADKKCNYEGLGDAILNVCDRIIMYGSNTPFVEDILRKEANGREYELIIIPSVEGDVFEFESTRENVINSFKDALAKAKSLAQNGEIVILSSIGTSYDHFRHFEHRGDMFKELVNNL